jgi:hypothetical protein
MAILGSTLAVIVFGVLLVGLGKTSERPSNVVSVTSPTPAKPVPIDISKWQSYYNADFGFELKFPRDWQVKEGDDQGIPVINIYKKSETKVPPFTHHSMVTQVSVFPRGIPTEGVMGETHSSSFSLDEETSIANDFVLSNDTPWASFLTFKNPSSKWQGGFVWAEVAIKGLQVRCIDPSSVERVIAEADCVDVPGGKLIRSGVVNMNDRTIEERIISTFRFIRDEVTPVPPSPTTLKNKVIFEIHESWGPCPTTGPDDCRRETALYASGTITENGKEKGSLSSSQTEALIKQIKSSGVLGVCTPVYGPDRYESYHIQLLNISKEVGEIGCKELQDVVKSIKSVVAE